MNTTLLRQALLNASVRQLEEVIDFLDRSWTAGKNDALRAAWHEARRSDGARRALAFAIEEEIRSLTPGRDAAHVAGRLGLSAHTPEAIAAELTRRLGGLSPLPSPLTVSPEIIASALQATADIARLVLGHREPRHGGRRAARHGGRRRHHHGR